MKMVRQSLHSRVWKYDIGNMLNKVIAAIEGVLKNNINFNEVKGKTKIAESGRTYSTTSTNRASFWLTTTSSSPISLVRHMNT